MPFQRFVGHTFNEAFIEERLGVSVSKLRSAQRLRLIQATGFLNQERRYQRVWALTEVAKAYYANETSTYLQVPFLAACESVQAYERLRDWDVGEAMISNEYIKGHAYAAVILYDRSDFFFCDTEPHVERPLGRFAVGEDGRLRFAQDNTMTAPKRGHWTSRAELNAVMVRQSFHDIMAKVEVDA